MSMSEELGTVREVDLPAGKACVSRARRRSYGAAPARPVGQRRPLAKGGAGAGAGAPLHHAGPSARRPCQADARGCRPCRVDQGYPGLHAEIMLRARYVDELIAAGGFEQLVMLGAGYDSTAFRHSLPVGAQIFEVDSPQTQRAKRAAIERGGLEPMTPVTYCPCDFEIDSPANVLGESRFDAARTSLTIWLGVSPYLTLEAFRGALEDAASFTASGGRLVWDYIDADVVDGSTSKEGGRRAAEWVIRRGEPYLLGFTPDQGAAELERAGFRLVEHLRTDELAARFAPPAGVWCSTDPWMGVMLGERT